MSKLVLKAEQLEFPIDKDACGFSEVLAKEFQVRESAGNFGEPHVIPFPKRILPMLAAYLASLKLKGAEITNTQPLTIENTIRPFQKMVEGLELNSQEFKDILTFQQTYKIKDLDDNLAYFIACKLKGLSGETLATSLGLVYDGASISNRNKQKISYEIHEVK